jgi:hypothetical protein
MEDFLTEINQGIFDLLDPHSSDPHNVSYTPCIKAEHVVVGKDDNNDVNPSMKVFLALINPNNPNSALIKEHHGVSILGQKRSISTSIEIIPTKFNKFTMESDAVACILSGFNVNDVINEEVMDVVEDNLTNTYFDIIDRRRGSKKLVECKYLIPHVLFITRKPNIYIN